MARLILARLLQYPLILAVIFLVTFALAWIVPGDPLAREEGQRPPIEVQQAMRAQYHLDSPTTFIYEYVRGVVTRLDFGPSLHYRDQRVSDIIAQGMPISLTLGVVAVVMALFIGVGAGVIGALWPHSPLDATSLIVALLGVSLPTFVTGSVLLALFAGLVQWAPIGPWEWPGWNVSDAGWWAAFGEMLKGLVLPALTLAAMPAAYIARLIRLGLADVMTSDYVRTARAKGLSHTRVLFGHALKVAFLPVLSFLGPAAAMAMTGSFVVEKVFALPGMGEHFVNAVLNKDQFLILGVVLVYSTMLITFNLAVDVAYVWIDPRIEVK